MASKKAQDILRKIQPVKGGNSFLKYIVRRLERPDYRGWHVSQHNRYGLEMEKMPCIPERKTKSGK